jgi:hypothetical protein
MLPPPLEDPVMLSAPTALLRPSPGAHVALVTNGTESDGLMSVRPPSK